MDRWDGEYGTNFAIPNFTLWVRDMKIPWWLADLRGSYLNAASVADKSHAVKPAPQPVDPLGMSMNRLQQFEELVELLLH